MNVAGALLTCILKRPEDSLPWLVLADWLEERCDQEGALRAEFIRLRTEWATTNRKRQQRRAEEKAMSFLHEHPTLIGHLYPLISNGYQSLPSTSPPAGVLAAAQVVCETPEETDRTLPSHIATFIPPGCPDCPLAQSQNPIWGLVCGTGKLAAYGDI